MLAYSSIENMGIIAIGLGIGGIATYAALLHTVVHSLTKGAFFLTAGNIYHAFKTKEIAKVKGLLGSLNRNARINGWLWVVCFIAISAVPPFPSFTSEFLLVRGLFHNGYYIMTGVFFLLLTVILYGMGRSVLGMSFGETPTNDTVPASNTVKPSWHEILPPVLLLAILAVLGVFMPGWVHRLLESAARELAVF
jgi:hydrogenase-4 component F